MCARDTPGWSKAFRVAIGSALIASRCRLLFVIDKSVPITQDCER